MQLVSTIWFIIKSNELLFKEFEGTGNDKSVKSNKFIEDILDFLRNAKLNCGHKPSNETSKDEKDKAKALFDYFDNVLEEYQTLRKEELERKKQEQLNKINGNKQKKRWISNLMLIF